MSINPELIVLAREAREWTQRELASQLGVSQAALSKYELGLLQVPEDVIEQLARLLDFDRDFFSQSVQVVGLSGDFLYRRRAHVPAKVRRRVQAEVNIRKLQLERLMKRADVMRDDLPFPAIQVEELESPERVAQEVRRAWRMPDGPVRNLTAAIENAGGVVFVMDFQTDLIDGTNVRRPGAPPMLFVNKNVSGDRHRFNLAHELAHTVMHFGAVLGDAEEEANRFASEFLMPKALIRSDLRNITLARAAELKLVWGVSMAAIIRRAFDLKIISEAKYRRFFTTMNAKGLRSREPLEVAFEKPEVFDHLIAVHRNELNMSEEQARKVLFTEHLGPKRVQENRLTAARPNLRLTPSLFDDQRE